LAFASLGEGAENRALLVFWPKARVAVLALLDFTVPTPRPFLEVAAVLHIFSIYELIELIDVGILTSDHRGQSEGEDGEDANEFTEVSEQEYS